jgi:hypothetical protein
VADVTCSGGGRGGLEESLLAQALEEVGQEDGQRDGHRHLPSVGIVTWVYRL